MHPHTTRLKGALFLATLLSLGACSASDSDSAKAGAAPSTDAVASTDSASDSAATKPATPTEAIAAIEKTLRESNPKIEIRSIVPSAIPDIYEVQVIGRGIIYTNPTGEYFFDGPMLKIEADKVVNITDSAMSGLRAELMAKVSRDDEIIFSPEGPVKASISVFTDVDCGFCQRLHKEVPQLNSMGIEVRYLAYPRAGIPSPSYDKIATAWCSDNPRETLTKLKMREAVEINVCENNPVPELYQLGRKIGITGTPAIVLDSGELIPGYRPADALAEKLGIKQG